MRAPLRTRPPSTPLPRTRLHARSRAPAASRVVHQFGRFPIHRRKDPGATDDGIYAIRSSAPHVVKAGTIVTYAAEQRVTTFGAPATRSYEWTAANDPSTYSEGLAKYPNYKLFLQGPATSTWTLAADVPGTHRIRVNVLLNGAIAGKAEYAQTVTDDTTAIHKQIAGRASQTTVDKGTKEWSTSDILAWKTLGDAYIRLFKMQWIRGYRRVIQEAAKDYDLPVVLVGGVAYNEVGGDPAWIDDLAFDVRRFDHSADPYLEPLTMTKKPELTSFGPVSMQLRRGAETLGYNTETVTPAQEAKIIASLKDSRQNVFIAARHLAFLRDIDFKGKGAATMTVDDIRVTATRFNRGPDLSLAKIRENLSYGNAIVKRYALLEALLA